MILHPIRVRKGLECGIRYSLKKLLCIPPKPQTPVLDSGQDAFERHFRIVKLLGENLPAFPSGLACEVGSGDCLATADLMLGAGFDQVYLVEKQKISVDSRQRNILTKMANDPTLPNCLNVLSNNGEDGLNTNRVIVIQDYFENSKIDKKVNFLFSFDVVEHVEDLASFFSHCYEIIVPSGTMVHKFDLSGHEWFEDPIPPLDFQTYPDWLYGLIFPKYRRACRWFMDQISSEIKKAGFDIIDVTHLKVADRDYVQRLKPKLRAEAQKRTIEELIPLELVIKARKL